jgi:hypothetical protein
MTSALNSDPDGGEMFKAICKLGLEGSSQRSSARPNKSVPSKTWLKVKSPKAPATTRALDGPFEPLFCGAKDYSNVIYMNGAEQLHSILIHIGRPSLASKGAHLVEELLMNKTRLTFVAAACSSLLALASMSGAIAAPLAPIGKAATENDFRSTVHYYGYYHHRHHRYGYHHRHHRHCWWRHGHRHCRWW